MHIPAWPYHDPGNVRLPMGLGVSAIPFVDLIA